MSSSPSNKEYKKYKKSCKTIIEIIEKYGTIDKLKTASNEFRQTKQPRLKKAYNAYSTYRRHQKKKQTFEKEYNINKNIHQDVSLTSSCAYESQTNQSVHPSSQNRTSNFVSDEESVVQSDNDENIDRNIIEESIDNNHHQQQTESVDNDVKSLDVRCCDNCHRRQSIILCNEYDEQLPYRLIFYESTTLHVNSRRKFKFVESTQNEDNSSDIILCEQCYNHLINDDLKVAKDVKNCWPGFMWGILCDENIQNVYGEVIWRFLPHQWRYWWLESVIVSIPSLLNITIDIPSSFIVDVTSDIKQWNADFSSKMLSRLAKTCNQYLMPNILCPWDCSEYLHKAGYLPFDIVFKQYLPKVLIKK